jgi:hypothetical protein
MFFFLRFCPGDGTGKLFSGARGFTRGSVVLFFFRGRCGTFKHGKYIALNGGFASGGETILNGMDRFDDQENWRIGATFSTPVFNRHQSVKFMINTRVATRAGQNYTAVTLAYQYNWF